MNILVVSNSSMGLVKFRKELLQEIKKKHNVFIATKLDECVDQLYELGVKVHELSMDRRSTNLFFECSLFLQVIRLILNIKPDFIISYTIKPNLYAGIIARLLHIPYVANITGLGTTFQTENFFKKMIICLYRVALKKAKVVYFENTENERVFLINHIIKPDQSCVLKGAGVNLEEFSYEAYPDSDNSTFLFMGRVMKEKGVEELFEAMERLQKLYPKVKLIILGEYEEDYEKRVREIEKKGIIDYVGWVPDVKPYIINCICSVLPSYHEGMSNSLLESAAMGRPLITSDIPGCREAVDNEKSGYLVPVKDTDRLYIKMKQFYELPHSEKVNMSRNARIHVENNFDKSNVIQKTIDRMGIE